MILILGKSRLLAIKNLYSRDNYLVVYLLRSYWKVTGVEHSDAHDVDRPKNSGKVSRELKSNRYHKK